MCDPMRVSEELKEELERFRAAWAGRTADARYLVDWWRIADRYGLNHSALVAEAVLMLEAPGSVLEATVEPTGTSRTFSVTDTRFPTRPEHHRILRELAKAGIPAPSIDWITADVGPGRVGMIATIRNAAGEILRPPRYDGPVRAFSLSQLLHHVRRKQLDRGVVKGAAQELTEVTFGEPQPPEVMADGTLRHRPAPVVKTTKRALRTLPVGFADSWARRVKGRAANLIAVLWDDSAARIVRPYTITLHMLPQHGRRAAMANLSGRSGLARAMARSTGQANAPAAKRAHAPLLEPSPVNALLDLFHEVTALDLRAPKSAKGRKVWESLLLKRLTELQDHLLSLDTKFTFLTVTPTMTKDELLKWWPEVERKRKRAGGGGGGINSYRRAQASLWAGEVARREGSGKTPTWPEIERWYEDTFPDQRYCHTCNTAVFCKDKDAGPCPGCAGPTSTHSAGDLAEYPTAGAIREAVRRYRRTERK